MRFLENFTDGFWFGLGFSFASFTLASVSILAYFSSLDKRKNRKLRKKLTLDMLDEYHNKIIGENKFSECKIFQKHIAAFKKGTSLRTFFRKYDIKREKSTAGDVKVKGKYYIVNKNKKD